MTLEEIFNKKNIPTFKPVKPVPTPFAATKAGIIVNTLLGLPKAAKNIFFPVREFPEIEDRKLIKITPEGNAVFTPLPSRRETTLGVGRVIAEFSSIIGDILASAESPTLAQKISQTRIGGKLADVGAQIQEFAVPKTPEQASAMRIADILVVFPVGSVKVSATGAEAIAKSRSIKEIAKILRKEVPAMTEKQADTLSVILRDVDNAPDIQRVLNQMNYAAQELKKAGAAAKGVRVETKALTPTIKTTAEVVKPTQAATMKAALIAEARKYKSAEEFVRAQGDELYHSTGKQFEVFSNKYKGSNTGEVASNIDQGFFFTDNMKAINQFKETLAKGSSDWRGLSLAPKDVSGYRTITKIIPKNKFFDLTNPTSAKEAELLSKYFGTESGEILKGNKAIDHIKSLIKDEVPGETMLDALNEDFGTFRKFIQKKGYEGVITDMGSGQKEFVVFDPNKFLTKSQLTSIWEEANKGVVKATPKVRQMKTSAEIPSLERTAEEATVGEALRAAEAEKRQRIQKVSYDMSISQDVNLSKQAEKIVDKKDFTGTIENAAQSVGKPTEEELITTRKFKQTPEWQDFAKYAEENLQNRDIRPAMLFRHTTMTMERVAEFLDGGIGGRVYKEIVKPVYDSAKKMTLEGSEIMNEVRDFRILEGSTFDRDASLFAQGKLANAPEKSKEIAKYVRNKYDELLERLNKIRAKIGVEPIPKRKDYITHINELNTLSELFGGMERISVKKRISALKAELLIQHSDWTDARAFDAAKRQVEGLTGIAQYVDARQPSFRFAKQRLSEYEADPSIVRSFNTYLPSALRYIYQAENVARNKAFKDVLPANAREFTRLWNTEQVAGRQPPSFISPSGKRVITALRGTLGANTILGNAATTMMQLTSWPQVVALAGPVNTFYGLAKRLATYIPGIHSLFETSRTRVLRNLNIDIGLGDSLIDQLLIKIGKHSSLRNPAARTRQTIDLGRNFLKFIMETADQLTVGASWEAFYRKGLIDGLEPVKAQEFADILTGKTQASYFKEALPPFLNTTEGKTLGQFGVYGMNQWEMLKRDFGRNFRLEEKNPKSVRNFFKQFLVFLTSAYLIDWASEETFGRQPYDIKDLIDETIGYTQGEVTGKQIFDTSKETISTYIPFMSSVKFNSLPPVIDFGSDVIKAILGTGVSQEEGINNLEEKWVYNILLPYAGNQVRKSLQGVEKSAKIDLPFVKNTTDKINIETNIDIAKSILFGPYATEEAINYFENRDRREVIKEKYKISGSITSDENITKLQKMTDEEFGIYTAQYATSTLKTINRKMGKETTGGQTLESIFGRAGRRTLEEIFK